MLLVVAPTERELECVRGAEALCCGIGPVEAALQTARALVALERDGRRPDALLHVGVAGARGLEPPALVLGSEAVYCDLVDPAFTLPRVLRAGPDRALLAAARAALPGARTLPIATSARVGGGSRYEVEAMEGFGVLRAAGLAGVPAVELRAVSNAADEPDRGRWRIAEALAALEEAVPRLVATVGSRFPADGALGPGG